MIEINPGILLAQVVTFLLALGLLWKVAWGPMTRLLRERREKIQRDMDGAAEAKRQMEELKVSYEKELLAIGTKAQDLLAQARAEGEKVREEIVRRAKEEAAGTLEKARLELQEESRKALRELRSDVAQLSVMAAEKILRRSIDKRAQDEFLKEALKDLEKFSGELH